MHRRLVYIYLLNVPSFSSRYFNKIKRTSRLERLPLSLEILCIIVREGRTKYRKVHTEITNRELSKTKQMILKIKAKRPCWGSNLQP